jgi:hypothetical protein
MELTVYGSLVGEGTITNYYVVGYSTLQLYPKQQKRGIGNGIHNLQDGIFQKPASDRCAKKGDSF